MNILDSISLPLHAPLITNVGVIQYHGIDQGVANRYTEGLNINGFHSYNPICEYE